MKVLIIEDEPVSAGRLKRMINEIDDTFVIDGPLSTVGEVVARLEEENTYDLIFADIRLGSDLVFDAFQTVMPNCFVVFTTAYEEYALTAFSNNGIGYLLKPIDPDELHDTIEKARHTVAGTDDNRRLGVAVKQMEAHYRKRLLVSKGDEIIPVKTDDICYICKDDNVRIFLFDGRSFYTESTLNELEQILDPEEFFRINRQYITNINSFLKIRSFFNSRLTVRLKNCNDTSIIVSKDKASQFKKWIAK